MHTGPILVVEDHVDSRDMLVQLLQQWGYSVAAVSSGDEVIKLLNAGLHPRLILLDLMLPEMSGWTIMEVLQSDLRLRDIPVIVLTAVAPAVLVRNPIKAARILQKPYDYGELQRLVEQLAGAP